MLTPEQAGESLDAARIKDWEKRRERRLRGLPRPAHKAAQSLVEGMRRWRADDPQAGPLIAGLGGRKRMALFDALLPGLGEPLEQMWQRGEELPYQMGHERRAFRAPSAPEASVPARARRLEAVVSALGKYEPDVEWVAQWAGHASGYFGADAVGTLLAAVIDAGGKTGDQVFDVLVASADGGHEVGVMGRHVVRALTTAGREDGWDFVERLLLSAQRQEGLRQVILESVDEAHPAAFRRMLGTIVENDLIRFSATVRAVSAWLGLDLAGGDVRKLNGRLERLLGFVDDPGTRPRAIESGEAEDAYLALWATAFEDAPAAIPLAAPLLEEATPERRMAGAHLLAELGLTTALAALAPALEDPDLRVAARALREWERELHAGGLPDVFARLEQLKARMPKKRIELEPLVWEFTGGRLERKQVGAALLAQLGGRPPEALLPHLSELDSYARVSVVEKLGKRAGSSREARDAVVASLGDASSMVRKRALATTHELQLELTAEEAAQLEGLLTRKPGDLRRGVISLLLGRGERAALASADALLDSSDANQRLAALEILRRLTEEGNAVGECRERAERLRRARPELHADEQVQLDAILGRSDEPAAVDETLGLLDREELTPPLVPSDRSAELVSAAALALMHDLDSLVHEHRDERVTFETWWGEDRTALLGDQQAGFAAPPSAIGSGAALSERGLQERARQLPLRELWEEWLESRPDGLRDPDGFEFLRASIAPVGEANPGPFVFDPFDKRAARALLGQARRPKLRYRAAVEAVVRWLALLHLPEDCPAFLLDASETLLAQVPAGELARTEFEHPRYGWRDDGWLVYLALSRQVRAARPGLWSVEQARRLWQLERWAQAPVVTGFKAKLRAAAGARAPAPVRPPAQEVVAALRAGVASEADVVEHLLDLDRERESMWGGHRELGQLSGRQRPAWAGGLAELDELVDRCRSRIMEVELARGEEPTPASGPALALRHSGGMPELLALLAALGRTRLVRGWSHDGHGRGPVFSHLIRATFPGAGDTPSAFAERARAEKLPPKRLVELAVFAPQWAGHVEAALEWPELASMVWWLHAHTKDTSWVVDDEIRATWAAEAAERTPLTADELLDGAVDVDWFGRALGDLGEERWSELQRAAKFCSSGGGHKRATLFAEAMRGALDEAELRARVEDKRHQDSVRALGLVPLPEGRGHEKALLERYELLQEFLRTSRRFGSQRQASERRAVEIGLANLARTAGYPDPVRLGWAMEARGVADLADGPLTVGVGSAEVALAIDDSGEPEVRASRDSKPLKTVPAKAAKNAEVKALRRRATELRRQSARMRRSLEAAMVRGDSLTGRELHELAGHPLLAPKLGALVLLGEDTAGYLAGDGRLLRDHAGGEHAVGASETVRLAHPLDLIEGGEWSDWQRDCIARQVAQPFKQVFRELYVPTKAELDEPRCSRRYAGHQIQPRKAMAVLGGRGWVSHPEEGVRKAFHAERLAASLWFLDGWGSPLDVEAPTLELVRFERLADRETVAIDDVPPRLFSEVMRDLDLVVSVAHVGGVDPEVTASTIEMRAALIEETCGLLEIPNVRIEDRWALVYGAIGEYSIQLGSGVVHRRPGGSVCIVPVHGQHRGRVFLPFVDDDPKTAEVLSKVLLLARDDEIKDPTILEQLRG